MNKHGIRFAGGLLLAGMAGLGMAQTAPAKAPDSELPPPSQTSFKFVFGGPAAGGAVVVAPDTQYSDELGYGFEPGSAPKLAKEGAAGVASSEPFAFSIRVPEGNYRVVATLGDPTTASMTTVKAELRRLMVSHAQTESGKTKEVAFIVNTRTPNIPDGTKVRLKPRETQGEAIAWDDKIELQFVGQHPAIEALTIEKDDKIPTIYLMGDSTMTDQPGPTTTSWGQMLPVFFNADVAIANHGESGESYGGEHGELRLAKVLSLIKPGDWVIIQNGHNDEKDKGENAGAYKNFTTEMKYFADEIRKKQGKVVFVTPMERCGFAADGKVTPSHGDYPDAVRKAGKELDVPVIDLTAMSVKFYEALGPEKTQALAFSGGRDKTHHSPYGAYEFAKCIAQGIRDDKLEIAKYIVADFSGFDPAHPDDPAKFDVPEASRGRGLTPYGN